MLQLANMLPEYFAYLTIPIASFAIFLYIKDMIRGNVRPNRITWIFWGVAPLVGTYVGYKSGIPLPLLVAPFMAGFVSIPVLIASFFVKGAYWETTIFDIGCGILSAVAIAIWLITKNGILSLIFAILADLFAGIPTIIKSWQHSDTENATTYSLGVLNQIITFLIIKNFIFLNFAFPLYLILANTTIVLGIKKKYFANLFK